jgi:hypothetical protein
MLLLLKLRFKKTGVSARKKFSLTLNLNSRDDYKALQQTRAAISADFRS